MSDKLVHALVYGVLGALMVRAVSDARWVGVTASATLVAALLSTLYGISDEFHQRFVPGRSPEAFDVMMDAIGASGAAFGVWTWSILRPSRAAKASRSPRSSYLPL